MRRKGPHFWKGGKGPTPKPQVVVGKQTSKLKEFTASYLYFFEHRLDFRPTAVGGRTIVTLTYRGIPCERIEWERFAQPETGLAHPINMAECPYPLTEFDPGAPEYWKQRSRREIWRKHRIKFLRSHRTELMVARANDKGEVWNPEFLDKEHTPAVESTADEVSTVPSVPDTTPTSGT